MRRLILLFAASLISAGALGLVAQSAAAEEFFDPEPDCKDKPADIQGFHFGTTGTKGGVTSEVYGGAALCGTKLHRESPDDPLLDLHAAYTDSFVVTPGDIDAQAGATLRCANPTYPDNGHKKDCSGDDLPSGAYVGSMGADIVTCILPGGHRGLGDGCALQQVLAALYVDKSPNNPANKECNSSRVVQCLQSKDDSLLGYGNITAMPCWKLAPCAKENHDPKHDRYTMHIFRLTPSPPVVATLHYTEFGEPKYGHAAEPDPRDYRQCEYAGNPGSSACGGDPANWLWKNPPAGAYRCRKDKPEGWVMRSTGVGDLQGVPKPKCVPATWT